MYIKKIRLKNYRNYEEASFEFEKGVNLLVGENGAGKTNVLEAIAFCGLSKSFRTSKDIELIKKGEDYFHVDLDFEKEDREENIKIRVNQLKQKEILINEVKSKKTSELMGYLKVVTFKPEDLLLIKETPAERRKYIDMEIAMLDHQYLYHLQKYNKVLLQKNRYLKETERVEKEEVDIWNEQMVKYGKEVIARREIYIRRLEEIAKGIHRKLSSEKEMLRIEYKRDVNPDEFLTALEEKFLIEKNARTSLVGPHRDDLAFYINEDEAKRFASQGQQRTIVLTLKLSQIEYIIEETKEIPVLLLDDVLSELDEARQENLISYIHKMQTILTTTSIKEEIENKLLIDKKFNIFGQK